MSRSTYSPFIFCFTWWPGKRVDPSSPRGKALEEVKEEQTSPRRREALKRLVSLVKRKGAKRGHTGDAALFRLLHVDIFQVSPFVLGVLPLGMVSECQQSSLGYGMGSGVWARSIRYSCSPSIDPRRGRGHLETFPSIHMHGNLWKPFWWMCNGQVLVTQE